MSFVPKAAGDRPPLGLITRCGFLRSKPGTRKDITVSSGLTEEVVPGGRDRKGWVYAQKR